MNDQPHRRSNRTNACAGEQAVPIAAGRSNAPDWNSDEGRLQALMFAIDGLMPKNHLGG